MRVKLPSTSVPVSPATGPSLPARPALRDAPTGLTGHPPRTAAHLAAAPRNAKLPQALFDSGRVALNLAGQAGGPVGFAANLASAAWAGAAGATSLKGAALGAAVSVAQAAVKPGTPVAAAMELAGVGAGLLTGKIGARDAVVQGIGAALDLAGGVMPGPWGKAAQVASAVATAASLT